MNIGLVGHVDHGKTTLTQALSGIWTDTHSEEIRRGITIRLGYADAIFCKCPKCAKPQSYTTEKKCPHCGTKTKMLRRVSFVDAPGHETLMATMLSGAAIMDGAILVIAANEPCPQPQTKEHLMALEIIGVKNIIIVQNKIECVDEKKVLENYNEIKNFIKKTVAEKAPIIPISAQHSVNIDLVIQAIEEFIPTPKRDISKPARMYVARSFDINKPGITPEKLKGGVLGGSLLQGKLKIGDEIEVKPWRSGESIFADIASLSAGGNPVKTAKPGGLIGIGTRLDPFLTKSDFLAGTLLGLPGTLPEVLNALTLEVNLLERVIGTKEELEISEIKRGEALMLNIGTAKTIGVVLKPGKVVEMNLKLPVCAERGMRVAISRRIGARWRLIGYGIIR